MQPTYINELSSDDFYKMIPGAIRHIKSETQTSESMVYTSLVSAMTYSCHGNINVESHGVKPVSAIMITLAESGERKSTVDKMIIQPILDMEKKIMAECDSAQLEYESEMELWLSEKENNKKCYFKAKARGDSDVDYWRKKYIESNKSKPKIQNNTRLILDDTTIEGLNDSFANGSYSIYLTSNEGGTITKGKLFNSFAFLNKYWDGQPINVERKSSRSYSITNVRLSISLMIQREVLLNSTEKNIDMLKSSGFLARTFICEPKSTQGLRLKPDTTYTNSTVTSRKLEDTAAYQELLERLRVLIDEAHNRHKNNEEKIILRPTVSAQKIWDQQYNYIEFQLNPGGVYFHYKDIASRYMEKVSRIAAVLQYFTTNQSEIDDNTMMLAIKLVDYYTMQYINLFKCEIELPAAIKNAEILYRWLSEKPLVYPYNGLVKKNDIRKFGPNCIRDKFKLNEAIDMLLTQRRIQLYRNNTPKPTIWIQVMPKWSSL